MKAKVWRLYGAKDIVMSIAALLAGVVIANEGDGAIPVVAEKAGPIEVRVDPNFELIAMVIWPDTRNTPCHSTRKRTGNSSRTGSVR